MKEHTKRKSYWSCKKCNKDIGQTLSIGDVCPRCKSIDFKANIIGNKKSIDFKQPQRKKHHKCKGFKYEYEPGAFEYDCDYDSNLTCDECKYGMGRKDPEAKCNQP